MRGRDIAAVIERDLLRADDEKGSDDHTNTRSQLRVGGLLTPLFQALRIAGAPRGDDYRQMVCRDIAHTTAGAAAVAMAMGLRPIL
jgi:hypothetical protein